MGWLWRHSHRTILIGQYQRAQSAGAVQPDITLLRKDLRCMMKCVSRKHWSQLLSPNQSKTQIATYFAKGLLEDFRGSNVKVIVTCKGDILINRPPTLPPTFTSHNHEEADTQIPLLLLNSLSDDTCKHFDVYSPDTDILVVLMDLISNGYAGPLTSIILHAGKARSPKTIDIINRVQC